jgi:YD repeat-containing protein
VRGEGDRAADERLWAELVSLRHRVVPAPPEAVAAAKAAFAWRGVASAIAALEFDSAVDDDDDLARVRDAGSERRLRFHGRGRLVEVSIVDNGRRLAGRVVPPLAGSMALCYPDGASLSSPLDDLGQFFFDTLRHGTVSLRPVPADPAAGDFETEWVTI